METMMPNVRQVTPFVFTRDLKASCAFFKGLGIIPSFLLEEHGYAYCTDGTVGIRLLEIGQDQDIAEQLVYFDVEDVDALYQTHKPFLDTLPEGRVRGPVDQTYGQRELHVKDPDNCLLMFGHNVARA
mgnify:FL=1